MVATGNGNFTFIVVIVIAVGVVVIVVVVVVFVILGAAKVVDAVSVITARSDHLEEAAAAATAA